MKHTCAGALCAFLIITVRISGESDGYSNSTVVMTANRTRNNCHVMWTYLVSVAGRLAAVFGAPVFSLHWCGLLRARMIGWSAKFQFEVNENTAVILPSHPSSPAMCLLSSDPLGCEGKTRVKPGSQLGPNCSVHGETVLACRGQQKRGAGEELQRWVQERCS